MSDGFVLLKAAYYWSCPECGACNITLPPAVDLDPEEREAAYRSLNDLEDYAPLPEDWSTYRIIQLPNNVTCPHCKCACSTKDEGELYD